MVCIINVKGIVKVTESISPYMMGRRYGNIVNIASGAGKNVRSWQMDSDDTLLMHPRTVHAAGGNEIEQARITLNTHWFGNDIIWAPRPERAVIPHYPAARMRVGEVPSEEHVLLLWST